MTEEEADRHLQRCTLIDLSIKTDPALLRIYRHQEKWKHKWWALIKVAQRACREVYTGKCTPSEFNE